MLVRLGAVIWLSFYSYAWAQGPPPAPPLDPTPMTRPQPLCTVDTEDPAETLKLLVSAIESTGFQVTPKSREGGLEAVRIDPVGSENSDRLLVWLERDYREPLKSVRVFSTAGRFMKLFGRIDIARVQLTEAEEGKRFGVVRSKLIEVCEK